jgi:hypothetical protein
MTPEEFKENLANLMQARMSWPDAAAYATDVVNWMDRNHIIAIKIPETWAYNALIDKPAPSPEPPLAAEYQDMMAEESPQCTASSWRGHTKQTYGPGGYNRCIFTQGHTVDHKDGFGNVFTLNPFKVHNQPKEQDLEKPPNIRGNELPDLWMIRRHVKEKSHSLNGRVLLPFENDLRNRHYVVHGRGHTEPIHDHADPKHITEEEI